MLFIGIALAIAVGLAFLISADAGSFVGLTQQQTGQLVPLVIILIVVAAGMFSAVIFWFFFRPAKTWSFFSEM